MEDPITLPEEELTEVEEVQPTGNLDVDGEETDETTMRYGVSEEKLEEIRQNVQREIDRADNYYEQEIEPEVIKRHRIYEGDKEYYKRKFPKLSNISDVTASDFHDTVEWAIPSLIKVFFGNEDICKLQGVNSEQDERAAAAHSELIKYQLERCNDGFLIFYDWIKNSLIDNLGIVKCYWEREQTVEKKVLTVTGEELLNMQTNPDINLLTVEEIGPDILKIEYEEITNITKNQPKLEVIPPSEFRFSPEAKSLDGIGFVAHRKIVNLDYLRRKEKEGVFQNIDKVLETTGSDGSVQRTEYETSLNPRSYDKVGDSGVEDAKKEFLLYECYVKTDVNNDGVLEDTIVTIVGKESGVIVRLEENTMGRNPFFVISPIRDTLRLFPKRGISDLVGELQDLNTALLKQIIYNVATNNDKQAILNIDMLIDPNEFIDGRKVVRVSGNPSEAVKWAPTELLQPQVFEFLETLQGMKENRTGVTRYNQGMDANSLNRTATGITQIMNASNQRLELIARIFAETGVKQLFRHMIKMNQMFITEKVFTRITDKPKPITPEDLEGTIDITVNVGVVAGSKTQQLQNMQLLLQMYPQLLQAGICDVSHIAYAMGRIVESMGYKNVSDFVFPAEILKEAQMQGISPQMLMMMKFQEETGQTPPALKQQMDQQIASGMQSAAQQAGIYDRQAAEDVGQAPENQETDLSKQQYIQRIAPQPNASDPDRRDGVF
nr:MAG TPA: Portal protein [Caudoviricetes sp.]